MSDISKCQVVVRLQVEGIHQWKDCNIEEVSFLKHPHRHIFYIECKKEVTDDNRQIEIIRLKEEYLHIFTLNIVSVFASLEIRAAKCSPKSS